MTKKAKFHLPGLFEFYEFYREFLPLYREHREYFYEWAEIDSIYGAPDDCLWGGGRFGLGESNTTEILELLQEHGISGRLTFSNSLLEEKHLSDRKCNRLCREFEAAGGGAIVHSDLLLNYLMENYPGLYMVSSTTKVITSFLELREELAREEFRYVVPDFRINNQLDKLGELTDWEKDKIEFLCNECCWIGCRDRKECYENVSRTILDESVPDYQCKSPGAGEGYVFSKAMKSPAFIGVEDIQKIYMPMGFTNFKIEGRTLGSALLLEFILYYLTKQEHWLEVREAIYLDSMLNLF